MVSFEANKHETQIINKIVDRAIKLKITDNRIESCMDITACHCNDIKLDLSKMLEFDNFNFVHDFCGIKRHINRKTGKLEDCFVPRCSLNLI